MELEKIISNVQQKVGNTDFSTRTIQKVVELLPLAEGQEPDDAYFDKLAGFVTTMQGQYNHDFAEKFTAAKKNMLSEESLKDLSDEQREQLRTLLGSTKQDVKKDDAVSQLSKQLEEITKRLDESEKQRKQADLLKRVKESMRSQHATDDYVLAKALEKVELDDKKSFDDLVKDGLEKYDAELLLCRGDGYVPRFPDGGNDGTKKSLLDKKFEQKAKAEGWYKE